MTRHDTLFSLRYAVRVLERYSRFWARIDGATKLASLLAGSAAIAALGAQSRPLAIFFGVIFALLQALTFGIRPADKSAQGLLARRPYADLLAGEGGYDDAALEAAYQRLVAADELIVPDALRPLAYNDVVIERGCDPAFTFALSRWQRFVALLA